MAIVVEQIDKTGQVLQRHKCDGTSLTLGRAFDNDIILADPSVDAHHGLLTWDPIARQLRVQDRGALNGLWTLDERGKKHRLIGTAALRSGQRLLLGKTLLRVYDSAHPVPAAKPAHLDQAITGFLEHVWVIFALVALAIGLDVWDQYLDQPSGQHRAEFTLDALYGLLAVAVYSGFWALLGKNLLQDARYWLHLSLSFIVINLWVIGEFIAPVAAFNLQLTPQSGTWLSKLALSLLAGGAVYTSCLYATRMTFKPRLAIALLVPMAFLIKPIAALFDKEHFSPAPTYSRVLVAPNLQWRTPNSSQAFMQQAEALYPAYDPSKDNLDDGGDTSDNDDGGDTSDNSDTSADNDE